MSTFTTPGPVTARVRLHAGTVDVDCTAEGSATATVEALDPTDTRSVEAAAEARIELTGDRLVVDVPAKGRWRGGIRVQVRVSVPALSALTVDAGEVRLSTTGTLADLQVRTGAGSVESAEVRDGVDVKAGHADLRVGGAPRRVSFTTGNGTLTADDAGDVLFKTGNGKAVLGSTSGSVYVSGGRVSLDVGAARSGEVLFTSGAGNARVGVVEGTSVALDLSSSLGDVRCDLPMEDAAPAGGSDLKVRLKTGLGDLVVARA